MARGRALTHTPAHSCSVRSERSIRAGSQFATRRSRGARVFALLANVSRPISPDRTLESTTVSPRVGPETSPGFEEKFEADKQKRGLLDAMRTRKNTIRVIRRDEIRSLNAISCGTHSQSCNCTITLRQQTNFQIFLLSVYFSESLLSLISSKISRDNPSRILPWRDHFFCEVYIISDRPFLRIPTDSFDFQRLPWRRENNTTPGESRAKTALCRRTIGFQGLDARDATRTGRSPIDYARLFQIRARMRIALRAICIRQLDGRLRP